MEPFQSPAYVGMEEEAKNQLSCSKRSSQFKRKSSRHQKHERWCKNGAIQWMPSESTRPIEMLCRMMNGMEFPKNRNFMVESMRPIHEHIEQENSNHRHVFLRNLVNVRSQQQTRNPSKTEDSYDNSNKSSEQTQQRGRKSIANVRIEMGSANLLTFVARKEFLKRYDEDKKQQDNEDTFDGDVQCNGDQRQGHQAKNHGEQTSLEANRLFHTQPLDQRLIEMFGC